MLHKIAATKTSKEALSILEKEFGERGSSQAKAETTTQNEVAERQYENDHVSVSHTKHENSETSESHCVETQVDDVYEKLSEARSSVKSVDDNEHVECVDENFNPTVYMENLAILIPNDVMKFHDDDSVEDEEAASTTVLRENLASNIADEVFDFDDENATQEFAEQPLKAETENEKETATATHIEKKIS